jgi:hypothetical protein
VNLQLSIVNLQLLNLKWQLSIMNLQLSIMKYREAICTPALSVAMVQLGMEQPMERC